MQGQGPDQKPLSHFCTDPNLDIINIAFLNQFPDQTGGYPGTNFGNACNPGTYKNKDGTDSLLLSDCPSIGPDIITCQKAGKKVFLSLGGAIPSNQTVKDDESAQSFAKFLWTAFGPKTDDASIPRPFGDAVIDGFDFDIESIFDDKELESRGYGSLINDLRSYTSFSNTEKTFYISGAPQCVIPDAHLADAIETSWFDFIFVQFYNTKECSARAYFDHSYGGANTNISLAAWIDFVKTSGLNKHAKVYLGLPAAPSVVIDGAMYLQPNEAKEIIQAFQSEYPENFGGVMIYEATVSETNSINGVPYADIIKKDLKEGAGSNQQSTSASVPSTPATVSTNPFPSEIPSTLPPGLAPPSSSAPYPISSSSATYPMASGSGPSGYATSSGIAYPFGSVSSKAGTAPYPTGTASQIFSSGTAPYPTKTGVTPSNSATIIPSGASSGSLPSGAASSSVPYPISSASSGSLPSGSALSSVKYPAGNSTTAIATTGYSSSFSSSIQFSGSVPSGEASSANFIGGQSSHGVETSPSVPAGGASATSSYNNSPQSTQEVVTTEIVTSYLTTCPVTSTATQGGSQIVETDTTVSTVYSTITSTICTKCVAPPKTVETSPTVPTGGASVTSSNNNSPQTTQEVVTTEIVTSYLTTCPVTLTATQGGSQVVETGTTVSTVYSTITSTICTKCVAPPKTSPVPGSGSSVPSGPSSTAVVGIPGSGHQGPAPLPKPSVSAPLTNVNSPSMSAPAPSAPIQEIVTTAM